MGEQQALSCVAENAGMAEGQQGDQPNCASEQGGDCLGEGRGRNGGHILDSLVDR